MDHLEDQKTADNESLEEVSAVDLPSDEAVDNSGEAEKVEDDNAPKIKYLTPDSADCNESFLIAATTYKARLCNSIPKYIDMRLFEEIKTIIPKDENKINKGISNLLSFNSEK